MASKMVWTPDGSEAVGTAEPAPPGAPPGTPAAIMGAPDIIRKLKLKISDRSQPPSRPVPSMTGHVRSGVSLWSRSANWAMVTFWQVSMRDPGGAPEGAATFLQLMRLAGSAFLSLG